MPTHANSVAAYADVETVLQTALRTGGCIYELESPREAKAFRMRAYAYRRLLAKIAAQTHGLGHMTVTPYDALTFTINDDRPSEVVIRARRPTGKITPLNEPMLKSPLQSELEAQAAAIAKDLI